MRTPFALAQALHRRLAARIADQVITADAARREYPARLQDLDGRGDGRLVPIRCSSAAFGELEVRPADRACDRLGMETAIERILVLAPALGAELEARHAGVRPVVRQRLDQRVAWPALRAVDERVTVAAVAGIRELAHAVVAREEVRGHGNLRPVGRAALGDEEAAIDRGLPAGDLADRGPRERRGAADDIRREGRHARGRAADHDLDVAAQVAHVSVEQVLVGEPEDERTEADPLHPAGHDEPAGDPGC